MVESEGCLVSELSSSERDREMDGNWGKDEEKEEEKKEEEKEEETKRDKEHFII